MTFTKPQSDARQNRAEQIRLTDIRRIDEDVWEVDCINDRGEPRENVTIIPSRIYSPSKDMQFRGPKGAVGKYIRALAMEVPEARSQLLDAIEERRGEVKSELKSLKEEDSRLLHAQQDIYNL